MKYLMAASFEQALIDVWRQVLIEDAKVEEANFEGLNRIPTLNRGGRSWRDPARELCSF